MLKKSRAWQHLKIRREIKGIWWYTLPKFSVMWWKECGCVNIWTYFPKRVLLSADCHFLKLRNTVDLIKFNLEKIERKLEERSKTVTSRSELYQACFTVRTKKTGYCVRNFTRDKLTVYQRKSLIQILEGSLDLV